MKMNFASLVHSHPSSLRLGGLGRGLFLLAALAMTGCSKDEIQVYTVPKEKPAAAATAAGGHNHPQVTWKLPKDWTETGAGQMSVASFSIRGANGEQAQVTITPLARFAGRDMEIVNMWREQVGQEPLSREDVAKQFTAVDVGGEPGNLFEIGGTPSEGGPARIVTAMVHRSEASWFYKLAGDASLVEAQKPAFVEFLKSIQIKEGQGGAAQSAAAPRMPQAPAVPKPDWIVPQQWKELPAGQMQVAKFAVPPRSGATGEVFVSVFPNDTGGLLSNVNRWRREIGLEAAEADEVAQVVSALDPARPDAKLVDMTNSNRRLIAAIVPHDGSYWFFKLRGDAAAVTPEKDAFVAFVKSLP